MSETQPTTGRFDVANDWIARVLAFVAGALAALGVNIVWPSSDEARCAAFEEGTPAYEDCVNQ